MKRFLRFLPIIPVLLAACSQTPGKPPPAVPSPGPGIAAAPDAAAAVDPVCGMIRDSTWTDYSIHHGDTVWFCAALEKKAFDANPAKYLDSSVAPHSHH